MNLEGSHACPGEDASAWPWAEGVCLGSPGLFFGVYRNGNDEAEAEPYDQTMDNMDLTLIQWKCESMKFICGSLGRVGCEAIIEGLAIQIQLQLSIC